MVPVRLLAPSTEQLRSVQNVCTRALPEKLQPAAGAVALLDLTRRSDPETDHRSGRSGLVPWGSGL